MAKKCKRESILGAGHSGMTPQQKVDEMLQYQTTQDWFKDMRPKPSDIPLKLKEWRKDAKLSLRQVEQLTGVSNGYLSQLETGKVNNPSFETVVKLLMCYKIKLIIE